MCQFSAPVFPSFRSPALHLPQQQGKDNLRRKSLREQRYGPQPFWRTRRPFPPVFQPSQQNQNGCLTTPSTALRRPPRSCPCARVPIQSRITPSIFASSLPGAAEMTRYLGVFTLFKKHNLSPELLKVFYHCCIEMILTDYMKEKNPKTSHCPYSMISLGTAASAKSCRMGPNLHTISSTCSHQVIPRPSKSTPPVC